MSYFWGGVLAIATTFAIFASGFRRYLRSRYLMPGDMMRAWCYHEYGSWDKLKLEEIRKPIPRSDEVLVKVHAVSLNHSDVEFLTCSPGYIRLMAGMRKPSFHILGSDISGKVEAVGPKVSMFKDGDEVFGDDLGTFGGLAEYVCIPQNMLRLKPHGISMIEAAAIPQSADIAVQGMKLLKGGERVLINGAGGGAGTLATQIAKSYGAAEVTCVDHTSKLELMTSLGADHVIDYTEADFTHNGLQYDFIYDMVFSHPLSHYQRALAPGGRYYVVGVPRVSDIFIAFFWGGFLSLLGNRKLKVFMLEQNKCLMEAAELIESKQLRPVIDAVYSFDEANLAMKCMVEGSNKGKIVISLD